MASVGGGWCSSATSAWSSAKPSSSSRRGNALRNSRLPCQLWFQSGQKENRKGTKVFRLKGNQSAHK